MSLIQAQNISRPARIRESNAEEVSEEQARYLLDLISGTREFACSTLSGRGRTLYLPEPDLDLPALKVKGAGGLQSSSGEGLEFYSPQPNEHFVPEIKHIGLTPDLTFFHNHSKPKAYNSLRVEAAEMEFVAQTRLHISTIGFNALLWGEFLDERQNKEVDANGYRTGFSVMRHDVLYRPLSTILTNYGDSESSLRVRKCHDTLDNDELDTHYDLVQRIGRIKRKMATHAGLGRHSSTADNFLYNQKSDHLVVSDTDTVVDYRTMETPMAYGSQFLRDAVCDLAKRVAELNFIQHSTAASAIVKEVALSFLTGLFDDSVRQEDIRLAVEELGIEHEKNFREMKPEMFRAVYRLLLKSELRDVFTVQRIDSDTFYERAKDFFR